MNLPRKTTQVAGSKTSHPQYNVCSMHAAEFKLYYWMYLDSMLGQEVLASVAGPAAGVATGCQAASPVIEAIHTCRKKLHQARQIGQSHRAKQSWRDTACLAGTIAFYSGFSHGGIAM